MNMNGGTSASATDPHHHLRTGGYLGLGAPGLSGTPMTGAGNGFGTSVGGMGMSGVVGPELKHHADFLSRLLAATPSYMSEMGNPPPGFFSDWLRRLVTKPGAEHRPSDIPSLPATSQLSPVSIQQQQNSGMTFAPAVQTDVSNGAPIHPAHQAQGGKRRKRSRVNDHHLHHTQHHPSSGKEGSSGRESSPSSPHLNHNSLVSSALTSTISGASPSGATGSLNPFTHPLWFFPPFLPNPYMTPMGMGMNLPGLPTSPTPPYLGQSMPGMGGSDGLLASFRPDNLLHAHQHHFSTPTDLNLNCMKKEGGQEPKAPPKKPSKASPKKSSSFSISRLTSPSPSSNSSGGSVAVGRSSSASHTQQNPGGDGGKRGTTSSPSSSGSRRKAESRKGRKGTSDSGSETGSVGGTGKKGSCGGNSSSSSLCVDLRVSGRIWERSGVAAPPPRSIYKPLSAFHDPSDVNLTHSSQARSPDSGCLRTGSTKEEQQMIGGDQASLSTTYVLKNLQTIYQRVRGRAETSINTLLPPALPRRKTDDNPTQAHFNYSHHEQTHGQNPVHSYLGQTGSPSQETRKVRTDLDIKIPLPRPIKLEPNYTNARSPDVTHSVSRSPSVEGDLDSGPNPVTDLSETEDEGRNEEVVHVLSDGTENEDESSEKQDDKEY